MLAILRQLCKALGHHFWTEDISIRQVFEFDAITTHVQITDVYLLGLAVHKGGKLATLDQRFPVAAVPGGREALELLRDISRQDACLRAMHRQAKPAKG